MMRLDRRHTDLAKSWHYHNMKEKRVFAGQQSVSHKTQHRQCMAQSMCQIFFTRHAQSRSADEGLNATCLEERLPPALPYALLGFYVFASRVHHVVALDL